MIRFNIKTVSEANKREHWGAKLTRKRRQQADFAMLWRMNKPKVTLPCLVTFTRYSCKFMDSDNLAGAFKHVRDQLAKELQIDDGSPLIKFEYKQEHIGVRDHYFTVEFQPL